MPSRSVSWTTGESMSFIWRACIGDRLGPITHLGSQLTGKTTSLMSTKKKSRLINSTRNARATAVARSIVPKGAKPGPRRQLKMKRSAFVRAGLAALPLASAARAAEAAGEVKVGSILPLTGTFAQTGHYLQIGQQLAADLINAHVSYPVTMAGSDGIPSLGHAKLRLIFADSQGKPDQAATVAEQLITQDKVVAVLGSYLSATTQTASLRAEQYKVPFLNPDSSSPTLTERGLHWFFRISPHDGTFTQNMFDCMGVIKKSKGWNPKKIAIVHEDTLFGKSFGDVAVSIAQREGYAIVTRVLYPANTSEVQSEVQKVKASNPDVILQASYLSDSLLFMKTYKQQNVDV